MPSYPIELDLQDKHVTVVGLGPVGRRKASGLIEAGARVIGVDPSPVDVPSGVEIIAECYRSEHLFSASLVFAAATPEVNHQVVADANRLGIWVNSASHPTEGDFALPAIYRDGPLTLTVSTSGASPALASALRDRAALTLGPECGGLVRLLAELRPEILLSSTNPEARRRAFSTFADPHWLELFTREGHEATRNALRERLGLGQR